MILQHQAIKSINIINILTQFSDRLRDHLLWCLFYFCAVFCSSSGTRVNNFIYQFPCTCALLICLDSQTGSQGVFEIKNSLKEDINNEKNFVHINFGKTSVTSLNFAFAKYYLYMGSDSLTTPVVSCIISSIYSCISSFPSEFSVGHS